MMVTRNIEEHFRRQGRESRWPRSRLGSWPWPPPLSPDWDFEYGISDEISDDMEAVPPSPLSGVFLDRGRVKSPMT